MGRGGIHVYSRPYHTANRTQSNTPGTSPRQTTKRRTCRHTRARPYKRHTINRTQKPYSYSLCQMATYNRITLWKQMAIEAPTTLWKQMARVGRQQNDNPRHKRRHVPNDRPNLPQYHRHRYSHGSTRSTADGRFQAHDRLYGSTRL